MDSLHESKQKLEKKFFFLVLNPEKPSEEEFPFTGALTGQ